MILCDLRVIEKDRISLAIERAIKKHRKYINFLLLTIGVLVYLLYTLDVPNLSIETTILLNILVFNYILYDVSTNVQSPTGIKILKADEEVHGYLKSILRKNPQNAWFLQYSGRKAEPVIAMLLEKGTQVTLWQHDAKDAISDEQLNRIESFRSEASGALPFPTPDSPKSAKLVVYSYDTPASIRGILIDEDLLVISSYTHRHIYTPRQDGKYPNDKIRLFGANNPSIVIERSYPNFDYYKKMLQDQIKDFEEAYQKKDDPRPLLVLEVVDSSNQTKSPTSQSTP